MTSRRNYRPADPATVADVTRRHPAYRGAHNEVINGLEPRPHTEQGTPPGQLVYVHASGHWRPAVVERVTVRRDKVTVTVAHSTPTSPTVIRRKRVTPDDLRQRTEHGRSRATTPPQPPELGR